MQKCWAVRSRAGSGHSTYMHCGAALVHGGTGLLQLKRERVSWLGSWLAGRPWSRGWQLVDLGLAGWLMLGCQSVFDRTLDEGCARFWRRGLKAQLWYDDAVQNGPPLIRRPGVLCSWPTGNCTTVPRTQKS